MSVVCFGKLGVRVSTLVRYLASPATSRRAWTSASRRTMGKWGIGRKAREEGKMFSPFVSCLMIEIRAFFRFRYVFQARGQ